MLRRGSTVATSFICVPTGFLGSLCQSHLVDDDDTLQPIDIDGHRMGRGLNYLVWPRRFDRDLADGSSSAGVSFWRRYFASELSMYIVSSSSTRQVCPIFWSNLNLYV